MAEILDEIELAKYRRMAVDALTGHFPVHIYGDQSHIEVLAKSLEKVVGHCEAVGEIELPDENTTITDLDAKISELEGKLKNAKSKAATAEALLEEIASL